MPVMFRGNRRGFFRTTLVMLFVTAAQWIAAQQVAGSREVAALPDAPQSQIAPQTKDAQKDAPAAARDETLRKGCKPAPAGAGGSASALPAKPAQKDGGAPCPVKFDIFHPLGRPPRHGPLTSKDKLRIAASNVVDPFNLLTIGATAAITVGSNPQSGYGPGMKGWVKNSATLLTEDMTGAFFITYLIPSIAKEDPRYHRMPNAPLAKRIENVLLQPVWTQGDKGGHMPNYGMLIGVPAAVTLANVYVPGRRQGVWPTVETSATAIASAPLDNVIDEFLPDVAKHVSIHIVLIQRIVNHVTLSDSTY